MKYKVVAFVNNNNLSFVTIRAVEGAAQRDREHECEDLQYGDSDADTDDYIHVRSQKMQYPIYATLRTKMNMLIMHSNMHFIINLLTVEWITGLNAAVIKDFRLISQTSPGETQQDSGM